MKHLSDEEFQAYFEGRLPYRRTEMEQHVQACETCRRQFFAYQRLYQELSAGAGLMLSANFTEKTIQKIQKPRKKRVAIKEFIYWFTGILVGLGVTIYYFLTTQLSTVMQDIIEKNWNEVQQMIGFMENLTPHYLKMIEMLFFAVFILLVIGITDRIILYMKIRQASSYH